MKTLTIILIALTIPLSALAEQTTDEAGETAIDAIHFLMEQAARTQAAEEKQRVAEEELATTKARMAQIETQQAIATERINQMQDMTTQLRAEANALGEEIATYQDQQTYIDQLVHIILAFVDMLTMPTRLLDEIEALGIIEIEEVE